MKNVSCQSCGKRFRDYEKYSGKFITITLCVGCFEDFISFVKEKV